MGEILVERGFITSTQLSEALLDQQESGRLLGEICVERFGLDRFALAGALSEHWEEVQHGRIASTRAGVVRAKRTSVDTQDLRILLVEAEAARAALAARTEELEQRLAALEMLVAGVSDALLEPRVAQR